MTWSRAEAREFSRKVESLANCFANRRVQNESQEAALRQRGFSISLGEEISEDCAEALALELLELEDIAANFLAERANYDILRIITSDDSGPSSDPTQPDYNRLDKVEEVQCLEQPKIWEWPDGQIEKITIKTYLALGEVIEFDRTGPEDNRFRRSIVKSGPEVITRVNNDSKPGLFRRGSNVSHVIKQFGAATALAKRLLEAFTSGAI